MHSDKVQRESLTSLGGEICHVGIFAAQRLETAKLLFSSSIIHLEKKWFLKISVSRLATAALNYLLREPASSLPRERRAVLDSGNDTVTSPVSPFLCSPPCVRLSSRAEMHPHRWWKGEHRMKVHTARTWLHTQTPDYVLNKPGSQLRVWKVILTISQSDSPWWTQYEPLNEAKTLWLPLSVKLNNEWLICSVQKRKWVSSGFQSVCWANISSVSDLL